MTNNPQLTPTAVVEPASALMLGIGGLGLLGCGWRRRKRAWQAGIDDDDDGRLGTPEAR